MTLEEMLDREAIRKLMTHYNINGDRGRLDGLASCFAEDGVLEFGTGRGVGPAQIAEALSSGALIEGLTLVRHNLTTSEIQVAADHKTAKGRTYFMVISNSGPDHSGVYVDDFAKQADGNWKIARREVRIDWQAATSMYPKMQLR